MTTRFYGPSSLLVVIGFGLLLGSSAEAFAKGPKISVGDDPSIKEGSPNLILVEVADFQ